MSGYFSGVFSKLYTHRLLFGFLCSFSLSIWPAFFSSASINAASCQESLKQLGQSPAKQIHQIFDKTKGYTLGGKSSIKFAESFLESGLAAELRSPYQQLSDFKKNKDWNFYGGTRELSKLKSPGVTGIDLDLLPRATDDQPETTGKLSIAISEKPEKPGVQGALSRLGRALSVDPAQVHLNFIAPRAVDSTHHGERIDSRAHILSINVILPKTEAAQLSRLIQQEGVEAILRKLVQLPPSTELGEALALIRDSIFASMAELEQFGSHPPGTKWDQLSHNTQQAILSNFEYVDRSHRLQSAP